MRGEQRKGIGERSERVVAKEIAQSSEERERK